MPWSAVFCATWLGADLAAARVRLQAGGSRDLRARSAAHPVAPVRPDAAEDSGIGPASTRVILEVLDTGTSPTVERAVALSERRAEIERRRALRSHFLSRAEVLRILNDTAFDGPGARTTGAICRCTRSGATALPRSRRSSRPAWSEVRVRGRHRSLHGWRSQAECRWPRRRHNIAPSMRSTRSTGPDFD